MLRTLWSTVLERLPIKIELLDHQKDVLSLVSILSLGGLWRALFGKKPQALFFPTIRHYAIAGEKYLGFLGVLSVYIAFFAASFSMMIAILVPFFDTIAFTHDFYMWAIVVGGIVSVYSMVVIFPSSLRQQFRLIVALYRQLGLFKFILFLILSGLVSTALVIGLNFLAENVFSKIPFPSIPVDPEPFSPKEYVQHFDKEKAIDFTLITVAAILLLLTSGRSLKPLAQFLLLAFALVAFGWLASIVIEAYPEFFNPSA